MTNWEFSSQLLHVRVVISDVRSSRRRVNVTKWESKLAKIIRFILLLNRSITNRLAKCARKGAKEKVKSIFPNPIINFMAENWEFFGIYLWRKAYIHAVLAHCSQNCRCSGDRKVTSVEEKIWSRWNVAQSAKQSRRFEKSWHQVLSEANVSCHEKPSKFYISWNNTIKN